MTRRALLIVAAGATFALEPIVARLGIVANAAALITLGILLALAVSGTLTALGAAGGAMGAFAQGALIAVSPAAAGAALVGLCYGERTLRVRGAGPRLMHIATALAAGATAGALAAAYSGSSLVERGVAVVISAVLVALPTVIAADDPLAAALGLCSEQVSEPARSALEAGAELRRDVADELLDPATRKEMRATWRSLFQLAQARVKLERKHGAAPQTKGAEDPHSPSHPAMAGRVPRAAGPRGTQAVVARLDQRIEEHVDVLTRAYTAVDAATAAELSLADDALDAAKSRGETLEEVSAQLLSVDAPPPVRVASDADDSQSLAETGPAPQTMEVPELVVR